MLGRTGGWPSTSRSRGARQAAAARRWDRRWRSRRPDGLDRPRTAVAVPSPRLRRSSPSRACSGPRAPPSSRWTKPRTRRTASSKASHGLRSRHSSERGQLHVAADDPQRRRSGRAPVVSRLAGRIECRKARRRAASTGAARRSLSIRSMIAARPTSWRGVCRSSSSSIRSSAPSTAGKRAAQGRADRVGPDVGVEPDEVLVVERRLALLAAAALVAADRAAVVPGDRSRLGRLGAGLGGRVHRPRELVDDQRPPQVAQRVAYRSPSETFRLDSRRGRGRHALERRVEVADVGRPQDDLGEDAGQRARIRGRSPGAAGRPRRGRPSRPVRTGRRRRHRRWSGPRSGTRRGPAGAAAPTDRRPGAENPGSWSEGEARPLIGRC